MKAPSLRDPIAAELMRLMGARIRRARVDKGLTQEQLAMSLGARTLYIHGGISKIESGKYNVSAVMLRLIAAILEKPMDYFFDGEELLSLSPGRMPADEVSDYQSDVRELVLWYLGLDEVGRKTVRSYARFLTHAEREQNLGTTVAIMPADTDKASE